MNRRSRRPCPICGGPAGAPAFPYATRFNDCGFDYLRCRSCVSIFIDPVPDADTFAAMYAKASYHDAHYGENVCGHYESSAKLLAQFLPKGASVLDDGCGIGLFLNALKAEAFSPTGVEFAQDAADHAARNVGCPAFAVQQFAASSQTAAFDALHLGDVLEHLPEPAATLRELLPP